MIYLTQYCKSRILEVSVPRDSRVQVPAHGIMNINRAFQIGDASLSEKTIGRLLNVCIHAIVDFSGIQSSQDVIITRL